MEAVRLRVRGVDYDYVEILVQQREVKRAIRLAGIARHGGCHTLGHSLANANSEPPPRGALAARLRLILSMLAR